MTKAQGELSGGKRAFSAQDSIAVGHPEAEKMNLGLSLTLCIKINSNWITDLNVKHITIKLSEKKYRRESSRSRTGRRIPRLDTKSMIHKGKKKRSVGPHQS